MDINEKYEKLKNYLISLESVAIAFSSGVDSTFLLQTAVDALGIDKVIAVTARSCSFPKRELDEATAFCEDNKIKHFVVDSEELDIDGFRKNPANRCYLCKHELFEKILAIAKENGIRAVCEGSNMDDNGDYRPGLTAVAELGIKSPLRYAQLSKQEIRDLSKERGLTTWDKPSFACLSSRFVYGETISEERLGMVDRAEQLLMDIGFHQIRVRVHGEGKGTIARIELDPEEFPLIMKDSVREMVDMRLKSFGFAYVTLDLLGYRTGSMNQMIDTKNFKANAKVEE
ncbi:MAG: ATP-dependent sacrificial sulfur transferase LarE [Lachnospiraceae bacterium]|nr:ATP-dependent sacrificial sulfur transferase LarE [Lachnospiraceae bacterium]